MAGGRPSSYTAELADNICERIAAGDNLNRISKEDGYPSQDTLYKWLLRNQEFAEKYARARESRADARSDRLDDLKRDIIEGKITPDAARVVADIEKYQAGCEAPKKYGKAAAGDSAENPLHIKGDVQVNASVKVCAD